MSDFVRLFNALFIGACGSILAFFTLCLAYFLLLWTLGVITQHPRIAALIAATALTWVIWMDVTTWHPWHPITLHPIVVVGHPT